VLQFSYCITSLAIGDTSIRCRRRPQKSWAVLRFAAAAAAHYIISEFEVVKTQKITHDAVVLYTILSRHGVFVLKKAKFRLLQHVSSKALQILLYNYIAANTIQ